MSNYKTVVILNSDYKRVDVPKDVPFIDEFVMNERANFNNLDNPKGFSNVKRRDIMSKTIVKDTDYGRTSLTYNFVIDERIKEFVSIFYESEINLLKDQLFFITDSKTSLIKELDNVQKDRDALISVMSEQTEEINSLKKQVDELNEVVNSLPFYKAVLSLTKSRFKAKFGGEKN